MMEAARWGTSWWGAHGGDYMVRDCMVGGCMEGGCMVGGCMGGLCGVRLHGGRGCTSRASYILYTSGELVTHHRHEVLVQ